MSGVWVRGSGGRRRPRFGRGRWVRSGRDGSSGWVRWGSGSGPVSVAKTGIVPV